MESRGLHLVETHRGVKYSTAYGSLLRSNIAVPGTFIWYVDPYCTLPHRVTVPYGTDRAPAEVSPSAWQKMTRYMSPFLFSRIPHE